MEPNCQCGHARATHLWKHGYAQCRHPACDCPGFVVRGTPRVVTGDLASEALFHAYQGQDAVPFSKLDDVAQDRWRRVAELTSSWMTDACTEREEARERIEKLEAHVKHLTDSVVDVVIHCPECGQRHVDEGEFATKPHHTHSCQHCGMTWRPAVVPTRGVWFLPGFKNEATSLREGEHLGQLVGIAYEPSGDIVHMFEVDGRRLHVRHTKKS